MTSTETLQAHLQLCDELHQLALEENRFLKQQQRPTEATLLDRKRLLLERLDASLTALKSIPPVSAHEDPEQRKAIIEKSRGRILQLLHLDRENEQLLLRHSLGVRPARLATHAPTTPPPVSQLQRLYNRHG